MRSDHSGSSSSSGIEPFPLSFTGSGGEFFRLWLVNLLLKIVTLGLYTPFARRRTAQYFFGHTMVAGSPLEFTAQQRKMVASFLLLVMLYFLYKVLESTGQQTAASLMLLAAAVLAPFFWGSAMRFRLASTRWRGVRMQFGASWVEVYKASWPVFAAAALWIGVSMVLYTLEISLAKGKLNVPPLAVVLVLAGIVLTVLLIIRLEFNYKSLAVARAFVGAQPGRWKPVYRDFVRVWMVTIGVLLLSLVLVAGVVALAVHLFSLALLFKTSPTAMVMLIPLLVIAGIVLMVLASAPARAFREARMFQLVWNNVGVSHMARFRSDLHAGRYVALRVRNILFTLLTLGFYRPFALVSEYRMKTDSVTLHVKGGLDQLVGRLVQQQGALGDALADAVGLDLVG